MCVRGDTCLAWKIVFAIDRGGFTQLEEMAVELVSVADEYLKDVTEEAIWEVSSAKAGTGVMDLIDKRDDTFWQSNHQTPHSIFARFPRLQYLSRVEILLNAALDDSYTPKIIVVKVGLSKSMMSTIAEFRFTHPLGWQRLELDPTEYIRQLTLAWKVPAIPRKVPHFHAKTKVASHGRSPIPEGGSLDPSSETTDERDEGELGEDGEGGEGDTVNGDGRSDRGSGRGSGRGSERESLVRRESGVGSEISGSAMDDIDGPPAAEEVDHGSTEPQSRSRWFDGMSEAPEAGVADADAESHNTGEYRAGSDTMEDPLIPLALTSPLESFAQSDDDQLHDEHHHHEGTLHHEGIDATSAPSSDNEMPSLTRLSLGLAASGGASVEDGETTAQARAGREAEAEASSQENVAPSSSPSPDGCGKSYLAAEADQWLVRAQEAKMEALRAGPEERERKFRALKFFAIPAHVLQLLITVNYQNGQDSHVRQVRVFAFS